MAHILFISRYYLPEKAAAAVCVSETAKRLVNLGHRVTVLTTVPNYPTGIVPPEYRGHAIQHEVLDGVQVVRAWSYITENKGFLSRILAQLCFGCIAPFLGWKEIGRPDIIIIGSPPLFNAIAGRMLAWLRHCPFIFMVADLWPESAVQLGALRNRLFIKLAEWLEWTTYQRAGLVWVVTEGIRNTLIQRGLSPERVFLLTNGVDTIRFRPLPKSQARTELGWDNRFSILHAGNHGLVYGLKTVIEAAAQLRDHDDIRFVFVGDGVEKTSLIAQAQQLHLKNVVFHDPLPHDRMPLAYAAADIALVHLRRMSLLEGSLPLKMFEAMSCERPILLAVNGEARRIAEEEAGAAIYVEPENPTALASAILTMREHSEQSEVLGKRGRAYVKARFDYDRLTAVLNERVEMLLASKASPAIREAPIHGGVTPEDSQMQYQAD